MVAQSWQYKSFAFAGQTNLTTRNVTSGDFFALACEVSLPKRGREKVDVDYATGQPGGKKAPVVGARQGGEISIKFPLTALRDANNYDPSSNAPGDASFTTPPCAVLLANALGSLNPSASTTALYKRGANLWSEAYDAAAVVSSSTTTVVKLDTGLGAGIEIGSLLAIGGSAGALTQLGWVKSVSTDDVTLEEAWTGAAANGNDILPSATVALNGNEQIPMTFVVRGRDTSFADVIVGAVCKSIKITAESGMVPMVEMTYGAYGDMFRDDTAGGVQLPDDDYPNLKPLVGAFGGRLTVGIGAFCAEKLTFDVAIDVQPRLCHSATQGVTSVDTVNRTVSVSMSIARDSADNIDASGDDELQAAFVGGESIPVALYVGSLAGSVFAMAAPSMSIAEEPALEDVGGRVYYGLKLQPATKGDAGDGSIDDASPQNSLFVMGWA